MTRSACRSLHSPVPWTDAWFGCWWHLPFRGPPCRPIISGVVLAPESALVCWPWRGSPVLASRAERRLPCVISEMRGAGAPPDKEIDSDAAGRHPASPLVAGALDAIIRGNRVREGGRLLVVFSVVSLSRSSGEGVLMARASSMMAGEVDAAVAAIDGRHQIVGRCHGGGMGTGRALKGGAVK